MAIIVMITSMVRSLIGIVDRLAMIRLDFLRVNIVFIIS